MPERSAFLERLRVRGRQTRERVMVVVSDLTDAQLSWRPSPKAHSIAYTLWHMARTEDSFQNDVNQRGTVWANGEYAAKWGYPEKGIGTGWDDERAASLAMPGKAQLLEYVVGEVLLGSITHGNRCLGEMEYIKGLQGMRGTATY